MELSCPNCEETVFSNKERKEGKRTEYDFTCTCGCTWTITIRITEEGKCEKK